MRCRISVHIIRVTNGRRGSAIEEVRFSLISNRGCYGGCQFLCAYVPSGAIIQVRSHESILAEAEKIVWEPDFKGYIHDVGGPTAISARLHVTSR